MLSVFLPTIRTHLLEKWYSSLELSCNRHSFEVVFGGPFPPPCDLLNKDNIRWVQDYGNPTRAAQRAALECKGDFLYHTVDDVLFEPHAISNELEKVETDAITAMRYVEGLNYSGKPLPDTYWYAPAAYPHYKNVESHWGIGVHFLIPRKWFIDHGGFDCQFEYLNHATHDLLFRMQKNGTRYKISEQVVSSASWVPGTTGDHAPIHYAQTTHDEGIFEHMWNNGHYQRVIKLDNWENHPKIWERRFNKDDPQTEYNQL